MAVLKEKIHHLDDMLKSQQRKVRHMIEQVRMQGAHRHTQTHTETHNASDVYIAHKHTGSH